MDGWKGRAGGKRKKAGLGGAASRLARVGWIGGAVGGTDPVTLARETDTFERTIFELWGRGRSEKHGHL